jgi:hypothetical protein
MADVTPSAIANAIMGKLYDVLTNGDETVPKSTDNFFSWCAPGIPVGPDDFQFLQQGLTGVVKKAAVDTMLAAEGAGSAPANGSAGGSASGTTNGAGSSPTPAPALTSAQLDELRASDTAQLYAQAEALSRIVDFVPDVTRMDNDQFAKFAVMNDQGTLSEIYERTLKMSQVMQSDLTDDVKQKIQHFQSLLTSTTETTDLITGDKVEVSGPSPLVLAYNGKMAAYDAAALEYNSYRIDALTADNPKAVQFWAINANILRDKVKAAMDDWISSGYKNDYEEIAAYISQVEGRDLTLLKQQYLDDLEKAKLTGLASGSDFYYAALVPGSFATSTGWTGFTFSSGDFSQHANSQFNGSGWSAQASASFFGFGAHGGASHSADKTTFDGSFNSDSFSLKFEIAQIPIVCPWFKSSYLVSKTWRFDPGNPDVKNDLLSDGGAPPKGLMPAYPTSIVFVRNLSLQIGHSAGFDQFMSAHSSSSQEGGGGFSFGPFSCGGSASHYTTSGTTQRSNGYSWDGQSLSVPGMQIAGFKCHVLPQSPNPSPDIKAWV